MKTYYVRFGSGDPRQYAGMAPTMVLFKLSDNTNVTPPGITEVGASSGIFYFQWGTTTAITFLADAATTSPGTTGRYVWGALDPADRSDEYGTTLTAIGTTGIALGTTSVALGTTAVSLGTTSVALGTTNVALGTTNIALGTTSIASTIQLGSTMQAIGSTLNAIGTTGVAIGTSAVAQGVSITAIGTTILSYLAGVSSPLLLSIGSTSSSFGSTSADPVDLYGYLKRLLELQEGNESFVKVSGVLSMYSRGSSTLLRVKTIDNSVTTVIKT